MAENDRYVHGADFIDSRRQLHRTTRPSRSLERLTATSLPSFLLVHFPLAPSPRAHAPYITKYYYVIDGRQVSRSTPVLNPLL